MASYDRRSAYLELLELLRRQRRKVFISFHQKDVVEVAKFVRTFDRLHGVFIRRALGVGVSPDIVNSKNPDYVMRRIRESYLKDSTITIVLIGNCTWARRYVDWEIQASLRRGESTLPNGLLGIRLPSYSGARYPERLNLNLLEEGQGGDCYARVIDYPERVDDLASAIDDAFQARTRRADLIVNPRDRFVNNRICP